MFKNRFPIKSVPMRDAAALEAAMTEGAPLAAPAGGGGAPPAAAAAPAPAKTVAAAPEDPEIDLSAHGLGKAKKSEIEAWKKSGMQEADYRQKTEELKGKEAQVAQLIELSNFLAKKPEALQEVLGVIDKFEKMGEGAEAGAPAPTKNAIEQQQAQIAAILEKMDPEDPASMLLKTIYQELQETKKVVMHFKKQHEEMTQEEKKKQVAEQLAGAKEVLNKNLNAVEAELEFGSEEEKAPWRNMVLQILRRNKAGYENEEAFVKAVKDAGKLVFKQIRGIAEAALKKHLESGGKGPNLPGQGASGAGAPAKSKGMTMENLQDNLESEFQAILDAKPKE